MENPVGQMAIANNDKETGLFDENYSLYIDGNLTKVEFAKRMNLSRPTLDKVIKKREDGEI